METMSAQVETMALFESAANNVIDPSDLIELVSGATLRPSSPTPSRMVTSSPILVNPNSQGSTRASSPSLDSTFSILGDQVMCVNVCWNEFMFAMSACD